jgi:hypothetical protein
MPRPAIYCKIEDEEVFAREQSIALDATRQQRARGRGHPRLAGDKSVHATIPKRGIQKAGRSTSRLFRHRDKTRVGQGHRPIR